MTTFLHPHNAYGIIFLAVTYFAFGTVLGLFYFRTLWWNVRALTEGKSVAWAIALMAGRFVLLGGVLVLTSLEGAWPLLVTAFGLLIGRFTILRRVRAVPS